jgi:hypothetical protein
MPTISDDVTSTVGNDRPLLYPIYPKQRWCVLLRKLVALVACTSCMSSASGEAKLPSSTSIQTIDQSGVIQPGATSGSLGLFASYDVTTYLTIATHVGLATDATAVFRVTALEHFAAHTPPDSTQRFAGAVGYQTEVYGFSLLGFWPRHYGLSLYGSAGIEHVRSTASAQISLSNYCTLDSAYSCGQEHLYSNTRYVPAYGAGIAYRWFNAG